VKRWQVLLTEEQEAVMTV